MNTIHKIFAILVALYLHIINIKFLISSPIDIKT